MSKGGGAPEPVDPSKIIPIQGAENRNTFDYQLGQNRYNTYTPYGSNTWERVQNFDQAGFDRAMADWNAGNQQGTWVPETTATNPGTGGVQNGGVTSTTTPGHWEGATSSGSPAPSRDAFTSSTWNNRTQYSPEQQQLFDAKQSTQQQVASSLAGLTGNAINSLNAPVNYYNPTTIPQAVLDGDQGFSRLGQGSLPTYGQMGDNYKLNGPQVNRGDLSGLGKNSYQAVDAPNAAVRDWTQSAGFGSNVRDWASALMPQLGGEISKLQNLNPWEFDQEGADASYRQATRYLDPQLEEQQKALESRLGEQGFVPGTPAYQQALNTFLDSRSQTYGDARDRATLAGRQYGDQAFDNSTSSINSAIAGILSGGQFGLANDQARDKSNLDMLNFGLGNDIARSGENLNLANFQSGQNQFGANFGLNQDKFLADLQNQDFNQQRQLGLDANSVIQQQFGLDKDRTGFNNGVANQQFTDLGKLTDQNNSVRQGEIDNYMRGQAANNTANKDAAEFNNNANNIPIQRLLQALGISSPGDLPGSSGGSGGGMSPVDIAGLFQNQYNGQVSNYNADVNSDNATMGTIGTIIAAIAM